MDDLKTASAEDGSSSSCNMVGRQMTGRLGRLELQLASTDTFGIMGDPAPPTAPYANEFRVSVTDHGRWNVEWQLLWAVDGPRPGSTPLLTHARSPGLTGEFNANFRDNGSTLPAGSGPT